MTLKFWKDLLLGEGTNMKAIRGEGRTAVDKQFEGEMGKISEKEVNRVAIAQRPLTPAEVALEIVAEYSRARSIHRPMHGAHEGYAVILEELDELWKEVKNDNHDAFWKEKAKKEAKQVAAMALAFILEV